jgi:hypothetical protein
VRRRGEAVESGGKIYEEVRRRRLIGGGKERQ